MAKDHDAEVEALYDAIDSLSDEFNEYLLEKTDQAALNWLRVYGMPETPNDVYRIFQVLYQGIPANLVKDGKVTLSEGSLAADEERSRRKEQRQQTQLSFDDLLSSIKDGTSGFGQYL